MKLSIITINYNNYKGLKKTFDSVFAQTYQEFEYIVIDGGSTDGSVELIQSNGHRLTYWVSEPDKGVYHAMNKGIDQAHGDYCIFMNSGDAFCDSTTIEQSIPYLDGIEIVIGKTIFFNSKNTCVPSQKNPVMSLSNITLNGFYTDCLNHQSLFINVQLQKKYKYDESLKIVADLKFYIQTLIFDNCSYRMIDIPIAIYDTTGISSTNKDLMKKERYEVFSAMIPPLILQDYKYNNEEIDMRLYHSIKRSRFNSIIYTLLVVSFRIVAVFYRSARWIDRFPIFLSKG